VAYFIHEKAWERIRNRASRGPAQVSA